MSFLAWIDFDQADRDRTRRIMDLFGQEDKVLGQSVLNGGNIRNNHINLSPLMHAFLREVIGGSTKAEIAPRRLEIDWGGPETVRTDIDGTKSIFRVVRLQRGKPGL